MKSVNNILPTVSGKDLLFLLTHLFSSRRALQVKIEAELSHYFPGKKVLLFNSGREAIEFAAQNLLPEKSAVYLQAFTCSAVVHPFLTNGINPIYIDIEKDTLNMSLKDLQKKVDKKTKALLLQYTFGLKPQKLAEIIKFAQRNKLLLIEDLAHSLGGKFKNKYLGTNGDLAILSFGRDKMLSTVSGGALVINNSQYEKGLTSAYENLTPPSFAATCKNLFYLCFMSFAKTFYHLKFVRILIFIFQKLRLLDPVLEIWEKQGRKRPRPIYKLAALFYPLLLSQLEKLPKNNRQRELNVVLYNKIFKQHFTGPLMKYPLQDSRRDDILLKMRSQQIYTDTWYSHLIDPVGVNLEKFGYQTGSCPVAESVAQNILNLPTHISTTSATRVAQSIKKQILKAGKLTFITQEVTDEKKWEEYLIKTEWTPFFQSWAFGEAEKLRGTTVFRFGVFEKQKKMVMAAQVFLVRAKRGNFLHLRHGPVATSFNPRAFQALLDKLRPLATLNKALFIRISPQLKTDDKITKVFSKAGFINAPVHNQDAEDCLILDLKKSEEELLQNCRKTTRYLIRKGQKLGIEIKQSQNKKDLTAFFKLYKETAERDNFVPHSGIEAEFETLVKKNQIVLFTAFYEQKPLASSLIVFYGKQGTYHHSGSVKSDVPANYLLQWEAIKEAKKRGMQFYNFWGVAPENKPTHPWQGLTTFKLGFGGERHHFLHAQDLPLSPFYWISFWYQKLWNWKRGYN